MEATCFQPQASEIAMACCRANPEHRTRTDQTRSAKHGRIPLEWGKQEKHCEGAPMGVGLDSLGHGLEHVSGKTA